MPETVTLIFEKAALSEMLGALRAMGRAAATMERALKNAEARTHRRHDSPAPPGARHTPGPVKLDEATAELLADILKELSIMRAGIEGRDPYEIPPAAEASEND
jgi:hypothetical protein